MIEMTVWEIIRGTLLLSGLTLLIFLAIELFAPERATAFT